MIGSYLSPYVLEVLTWRLFDQLVILLLRTPIPQHREALRRAGAPIAPETLGTSTPRPGILGT